LQDTGRWTAGVSLATASRAFNEPERLARPTRDRVLAVAAELGYHAPGPAGPHTIGVLVPDISNAVFARLVQVMQDRIWQGRHRMVLASTSEHGIRELDQVADLAGSTDGVILCSPRQPADALTAALAGTPAVVMNGELDGAPGRAGAPRPAGRPCRSPSGPRGHRRLAYVPGPVGSWADEQRLEAIGSSAGSWGMELVTLGHQSATVAGGLAAAASVISSGASAVIAYNDLVAIGLQAGARALGRSCPADISVVGVDDLDVAAMAQPGLTSIRVAIDRGASVATDLLLERLSGRPWTTIPVRLESQLIVRGSTARASAAAARPATWRSPPSDPA
jgi:DNA-binding LacI/PurR family transcriptional regulator